MTISSGTGGSAIDGARVGVAAGRTPDGTPAVPWEGSGRGGSGPVAVRLATGEVADRPGGWVAAVGAGVAARAVAAADRRVRFDEGGAENVGAMACAALCPWSGDGPSGPGDGTVALAPRPVRPTRAASRSK